jgi:FKBP-type peptidyl-prolyl cis-trans isomerase FkpA
MRKIALLAALAAACTGGRTSAPSPAPDPKTDDEKTLYAIGAVVAKQLAVFNLKPDELQMVKRGLDDAASGKQLAADPEAYRPKINQLAQARMKVNEDKLKGQQQGVYDAAAKEKGAEKTPSGLVYVPLKEGSGPSPKETDTVKVHYTGTLADGTVFDSSVKRGQPAQFPLNQVIKCWTEGVAKMKVGGKAKLVCPSSIAYGDQGRPGTIPGGATLIFDVELLEIVKK